MSSKMQERVSPVCNQNGGTPTNPFLGAQQASTLVWERMRKPGRGIAVAMPDKMPDEMAQNAQKIYDAWTSHAPAFDGVPGAWLPRSGIIRRDKLNGTTPLPFLGRTHDRACVPVNRHPPCPEEEPIRLRLCAERRSGSGVIQAVSCGRDRRFFGPQRQPAHRLVRPAGSEPDPLPHQRTEHPMAERSKRNVDVDHQTIRSLVRAADAFVEGPNRGVAPVDRGRASFERGWNGGGGSQSALSGTLETYKSLGHSKFHP